MEKAAAPVRGEAVGSRWKQGRPWRNAFYMTVPALMVLLIFYFYPILQFLPQSLIDDEGRFTLEYFARVFSDQLYLDTLLRTLKIGLLATLINLILGYVAAYTLTKVKQSTANILMGVIMISFWVSLLVRTYAWMVLLQKNGVLNDALAFLGIIQERKSFLYTEGAVLTGMTNILLPYAILPIYSVLKGLDPNLATAAMSMGATPLQAFWKVTLPLSMPGIATAVMLVFIQTLGFYVTPMLLGGGQTQMITGLIDTQVYRFLNWHFASALGMLLLLITVVFLLGFDKIFGIDRLSEGMM